MEYLFDAPYVVRVLGSLIIIPVINKLTRQLSLSIFSGILVLAFWTEQPIRSMLVISSARLFSLNTLLLLIAIYLIMLLSTHMSVTGVMNDLVKHKRSRVSQRSSMALLPAIIGLLPMPGGALFSAPLVDSCDSEKNVEPILKTLINYWFRHIWEYWWPLYPGVLLTVEISGLSIVQVILLHLPFTVFSFLAGRFFLVKKISKQESITPDPEKTRYMQLFLLTLPIIVVIWVYIIILALFPGISRFNHYMPVIIAIAGAQILLQILRPMNPKTWLKSLLSSKSANMMILVVMVLIYGAFIDGKLPNGTLLMHHMRNELTSWGFPIILIIMLIPFISGFTTGIAFAFVGASMPIVLSLLTPDATSREYMATVVLAFGSGYVGMLLYPIHVCLVVSNQHFRTHLLESMIALLKPSLVVLAGAVLMYFVIR